MHGRGNSNYRANYVICPAYHNISQHNLCYATLIITFLVEVSFFVIVL